MAKADLPISKNPLIFNVIGGVDESVQDTETDFGLSKIRGVAPYYTGSLQRFFGKKVIDVDHEASIMSIAQGFNGFGTFCYWVQTFNTLYCHTCPTPPDLFINYVLPTNLGVDENGFTRDIFGRSENLELPQDLGISCLFEFPTVIPPPDFGPLAWWRFEDLVFDPTYDPPFDAYDTTDAIDGVIMFVEGGTPPPTPALVSGLVNDALAAGRVGGQITGGLTDFTAFNIFGTEAESFSIMGWINPILPTPHVPTRSFGGSQFIFSHEDTDSALIMEFGNVSFVTRLARARLYNNNTGDTDIIDNTTTVPAAGSGWFWFYVEVRNGILGTSLNNAPLTFGDTEIFLDAGQGFFQIISSFWDQVEYDEVVIFRAALNDANRDIMYNGGAGVTWPVTLVDNT